MYKLKNCLLIAKILKKSRKTIQSWISIFNQGKLNAFVLNGSPGHSSKLTKEQWKKLKKDVMIDSRKLGYDFSNWEDKSVDYHIKKKFGVKLNVPTTQKLRYSFS